MVACDAIAGVCLITASTASVPFTTHTSFQLTQSASPHSSATGIQIPDLSHQITGSMRYSATFKFIVVKAALDGFSLVEINERHGSTVMVCDPNTYQVRGRPLALSNEERTYLRELIAENPAVYLDEIQTRLLEEHGTHILLQTISNELHQRLRLSRKSIRRVHPSQNINRRMEYILMIAHHNPSTLVFTDECGICLDGIVRTRGWAPVGERTARIPTSRATHRFNVVPAIGLNGLVAVLVQEENMYWFDFEYYLENILLPMMHPFPGPQSVLVLDNSSIHHGGRINAIIEARGCLLIYLPTYSPDLNPIEKGFSVLKANLRRYGEMLGGADDREEIEAFAHIVFTPQLVRSLFRGSGYLD
ncbi:uncharacterized protein PGTG_20820 [Puccinia graminis f. sp. tritici CRL 75-36-700-3]|uniref:Tc1-like transposase DDE domain-containing protein n=1 Tax=Puccinia graminis f. sp. tritici (strain CRL 75-36-700-3 / race SCCL) TaxID=418459 RepID=H6QPM1_PUCGT|nr:uncharacterized protein PGTG_20820 [Puccinia graminis f. sp. tritici CRL 75-36-700-3]EHS64123.1 hypothetical protein PGTG_20820 [Puccinia graminis f. sp. tritici CRL 75-36-700-3]